MIKKNEQLELLYGELSERLAILEKRKNSPSTDGRISELLLILLRVQQLLLENIKK